MFKVEGQRDSSFRLFRILVVLTQDNDKKIISSSHLMLKGQIFYNSGREESFELCSISGVDTQAYNNPTSKSIVGV